MALTMQRHCSTPEYCLFCSTILAPLRKHGKGQAEAAYRAPRKGLLSLSTNVQHVNLEEEKMENNEPVAIRKRKRLANTLARITGDEASA